MPPVELQSNGRSLPGPAPIFSSKPLLSSSAPFADMAGSHWSFAHMCSPDESSAVSLGALLSAKKKRNAAERMSQNKVNRETQILHIVTGGHRIQWRSLPALPGARKHSTARITTCTPSCYRSTCSLSAKPFFNFKSCLSTVNPPASKVLGRHASPQF